MQVKSRLSILHKLCFEACNNGTYGLECNNTCGYCLDGDNCSKANGTCIRGCSAGYVGNLCKTRKYT